MKEYRVVLKCNLKGNEIVIKERAENDDSAVKQAFHQAHHVLNLTDNDWKLHQLERTK